ncbi:hypothetical protein [Streptomyces sp. NPDC006879]|uniref:hypothetical protein n=1 Tax=Streptomyces sp. NPDC006879 TaxID=3364767 RepID=UPI0036C7F397
MSTPPHPPLEGPTPHRAGPSPAEPAPATDGTRALKVVAEGVPSAVGPDPHPSDGRRPVRWIRIVAPPSFAAPVEARAWCACDGIERTAKGRPGVMQFIAAYNHHRTVCPLTATLKEGRKAA